MEKVSAACAAQRKAEQKVAIAEEENGKLRGKIKHLRVRNIFGLAVLLVNGNDKILSDGRKVLMWRSVVATFRLW